MLLIDPHNGEMFTPKRMNQKYMSRKTQVAYNNRKKAKEKQAMSYVDQKLSKNRRILARILGKKKQAKITSEYLSGAGYDHRFITHRLISDGVEYFYVYEYAISLIDNMYHVAKVTLNDLKE